MSSEGPGFSDLRRGWARGPLRRPSASLGGLPLPDAILVVLVLSLGQLWSHALARRRAAETAVLFHEAVVLPWARAFEVHLRSAESFLRERVGGDRTARERWQGLASGREHLLRVAGRAPASTPGARRIQGALAGLGALPFPEDGDLEAELAYVQGLWRLGNEVSEGWKAWSDELTRVLGVRISGPPPEPGRDRP